MASRYLREVEWQLLHSINLYVYRNGKDGEQPVLVHIPPEKKKNMESIMKTIQDRIKFPIGYATQLYNMEGRRVRQVNQLEQYHCYVAASNYDKHFICTEYGRKRSPLLILNRDSKHVRFTSRTHNYERMLKKKFIGEEMPEYIFNNPKLKPNGNTNGALRRPTTYRTFQQSYHRVPEEFLVSTCPVTDIQRPDESIRTSAGTESLPQIRQQSPIDGKETIRISTSNVVEEEWTSEEESSIVPSIAYVGVTPRIGLFGGRNPNSQFNSITETNRYNREMEGNSSNDRPVSGSQERLNRRYLEIFKQAKSGDWNNQEAVPSRSYSILTQSSSRGTRVTMGSCNNRPNGANGHKMLVLPPPPKFQDESFLPEIPVFRNISLQNPSETFCSPKNRREIHRLADPPFVLLEGYLRPQLRKHNSQQAMTTSARSRKNISKRICRMLLNSGGLCSTLSFQPGRVNNGDNTVRPNSYRNLNQTDGETTKSRLSTPFRTSHNVSSQTFKNGQFMQEYPRLNPEPPQEQKVKLRISTPFRTHQNSSSQALNDGQSKQVCSRPSSQLQESGQPSHETIVIHNRARTTPQRTKDSIHCPFPSPNSQSGLYADAPTNPCTSSDKNIRETIHKNPSPRPKITKAKLIIRNGYSSS